MAASHLFPRELKNALLALAFVPSRLSRPALDFRAVCNAWQQPSRSSSGFLAQRPHGIDPVSASTTDTTHRPPEPIDFGLFEPPTPEYSTTLRDVLPAVEISSRRPSLQAVIVEALESGQTDKAERLRSEMKNAGLSIEPHQSFETWALKQLDAGNQEQFFKWWSLAPPLDDSNAELRYPAVYNAALYFIRQPKSLAATATFAVMAAEKGFAHIVGGSTLSHLVRLAVPDAVERCWADFADAASRADDGAAGRERTVALLIELRNLVLRGQLVAGRSALAVQLLERFRRYPLPALSDPSTPLVESFTYRLFLQHLSRRRQTDLCNLVESAAREDYPYLSTDWLRAPNVRGSYSPEEMAVRRAVADGEFDVAFENLLSNMRRDSGLFELPTVGTMAEILGGLLRDGLEARAKTFQERFFYHLWEKPMLARQHWWTVVMATRRRAGDMQGCLATFVEHFNATSLSAHAQARLPPKQSPKQSDSEELSDPELWPGSYALSMVYDALANLASSVGDLDALYSGFLDSSYAEGDEAELGPEGKTISSPRAHSVAAYNGFVAAYKRFGLPWRAFEVLVDMKQHGIEPNVFNWTTVVGSIAMHADPRIALGILERMHMGGDGGDDDDATPVHRHSVPQVMDNLGFDMPRATVVTYTNVMSALLIRGMDDDALRVRELMVSALGPEALEDPVLASTERQWAARRQSEARYTAQR
jgi:hypothetical protein